MHLFALLLTALITPGQTPETPPVPADFPRFHFAGHDDDAATLSDYLWYHFHHRGGNPPVLFNKEYLAYADLWLGGATPRGESRNIQAVHRDTLSSTRVDDSGYVETHQHFSQAHDAGWPFPLWTQAAGTDAGLRGITAGWHFAPLESVPGWAGDGLRARGARAWCGEDAIAAWEVAGARSEGLHENRWRLSVTAPSPTLSTPADVRIDAFNAPFLQVRWTCAPEAPRDLAPYVEWLRAGDAEFSEERRVYFLPEKSSLSTSLYHSMLTMYTHPLWQGEIARMRLCFPGLPEGATLDIDSFFTVYDTRHTINNPIFIIACAQYFGWTHDIAFLRENLTRMRRALRYQQTELGGIAHKGIRMPWWGHDGRPGWTTDAEGKRVIHPGRGVGANYWDLLPFGGDDLYATNQYHAATLAMAQIEEAVQANPGWNAPAGGDAMDPTWLRMHAAEVATRANALFWNESTGRFGGTVDSDGKLWDYGFTFLNLDAIWYGVADANRTGAILDWLTGKRIVNGDTSTGADIYHWRFGPRATTRRNVEWYAFVWTDPASIPWGGQVQDGGAVLGFTFYDLWARLRHLGADDAWQRLREILAWEREVHAAGGYRAYYADGKLGTTLQGCGTPGGLGVDCEFFESSLLPAIIVYGFLGIAPTPDGLHIAPTLPTSVPQMAVSNVAIYGGVYDIAAEPGKVRLTTKKAPQHPLKISATPGVEIEIVPAG